MIRDYPGNVTVRIASIAASAASVVAMAGNLVQMSPTALLMVHDPSTIAMGNAKDMEKAIATLNEVKESIINAYAAKTGLSRNRISKLMSDETWLNAKKAVELGFADEILFDEKKPEPAREPEEEPEEEGTDEGKEGSEGEKKPIRLAEAMWQYSTRLMGETILNRLGFTDEAIKPEADASAPEPSETGVSDAANVDSTGDMVHTADTDHTISEVDTPAMADTAESIPVSTEPKMPVIGMDGKTEDGSMPYEILRDKLEWMK